MKTENNVFIVNKQKLIEAALELDKQEVMLSWLIFTCIDQLADIHRKLDTVMSLNEFSKARGAFLELFMTHEEWGKIFTDELFEQWQAEAAGKAK